jgi:hypothetical protein
MFSDCVLSRRLERAEGPACVQFARAHRRLFPDSGADWIECAGAYAVFDGVDSPVTQKSMLPPLTIVSPASLNSLFALANSSAENCMAMEFLYADPGDT